MENVNVFKQRVSVMLIAVTAEMEDVYGANAQRPPRQRLRSNRVVGN